MSLATWLAFGAWLAPHRAGAQALDTAIMAKHRLEVEKLSGESLIVLANKSNLGLQALLDHQADLAMNSTALQNEVDLLKRDAAEPPVESLQVHSISRSRAVLIVHPGNPVRSLSFEQLPSVLAGNLTNWHDFGGPDLAIRVIATRQGGGVVTTVEARVLGGGRYTRAPDQVRVQSGPQIVTIVEQEPGALGISMESLARERVVAEVKTPETIGLELNLVSLGAPTPAVLRVIAGCREVAAQIGL